MSTFLTTKAFRFAISVSVGLCLLISIGIGFGLGIALGATSNLEIAGNIGEEQLALPSQILDRNGKLITEYFAEEKREIVSIDELPENLIYAVTAVQLFKKIYSVNC